MEPAQRMGLAVEGTSIMGLLESPSLELLQDGQISYNEFCDSLIDEDYTHAPCKQLLNKFSQNQNKSILGLGHRLGHS